MAADSRLFDPVQIANVGGALVALEGGVASLAGAALLFGWMLEPAERVQELTLVYDTKYYPVVVLDRIYRPDVVSTFRKAARSRMADVGFVGLAFLDPDGLYQAGDQITLSFTAGGSSGSSKNRLVFEPGGSFHGEAINHIPIRKLRPAALKRLVEAVLAPEAARVSAVVRETLKRHAFGPECRPALSVVIPILSELGTLKHRLIYLDSDPAHREIEVVLPLSKPWLLPEVKRIVLSSGTRLRIVIVASDEDLNVSGAARIGLESASAESVALVSEEVVPPSRGWVTSALDELQRRTFSAPAALTRFDGSVHRFEPHPLADGDLAWPHEDVREGLGLLFSERGVDSWSPGLLTGRKSALMDLRWDGFYIPDYFWADLLQQAHASESLGPLESSDLFVRTATSEGHLPPPEHRLCDSYLLYGRMTSPNGAQADGVEGALFINGN